MNVLDPPQRNQRGRFLTRNNASPGRPRGSRNRLSEEFLAALAKDFAAHGAGAITECRLTNPSVYVRVVAALVSKEPPEDPKDAYSQMSAAELREYIIGQILGDAQIAAVLRAELIEQNP